MVGWSMEERKGPTQFKCNTVEMAGDFLTHKNTSVPFRAPLQRLENWVCSMTVRREKEAEKRKEKMRTSSRVKQLSLQKEKQKVKQILTKKAKRAKERIVHHAAKSKQYGVGHGLFIKKTVSRCRNLLRRMVSRRLKTTRVATEQALMQTTDVAAVTVSELQSRSLSVKHVLHDHCYSPDWATTSITHLHSASLSSEEESLEALIENVDLDVDFLQGTMDSHDQLFADVLYDNNDDASSEKSEPVSNSGSCFGDVAAPQCCAQCGSCSSAQLPSGVCQKTVTGSGGTSGSLAHVHREPWRGIFTMAGSGADNTQLSTWRRSGRAVRRLATSSFSQGNGCCGQAGSPPCGVLTEAGMVPRGPCGDQVVVTWQSDVRVRVEEAQPEFSSRGEELTEKAVLERLARCLPDDCLKSSQQVASGRCQSAFYSSSSSVFDTADTMLEGSGLLTPCVGHVDGSDMALCAGTQNVQVKEEEERDVVSSVARELPAEPHSSFLLTAPITPLYSQNGGHLAGGMLPPSPCPSGWGECWDSAMDTTPSSSPLSSSLPHPGETTSLPLSPPLSPSEESTVPLPLLRLVSPAPPTPLSPSPPTPLSPAPPTPLSPAPPTPLSPSQHSSVLSPSEDEDVVVTLLAAGDVTGKGEHCYKQGSRGGESGSGSGRSSVCSSVDGVEDEAAVVRAGGWHLKGAEAEEEDCVCLKEGGLLSSRVVMVNPVVPLSPLPIQFRRCV